MRWSSLRMGFRPRTKDDDPLANLPVNGAGIPHISSADKINGDGVGYRFSSTRFRGRWVPNTEMKRRKVRSYAGLASILRPRSCLRTGWHQAPLGCGKWKT